MLLIEIVLKHSKKKVKTIIKHIFKSNLKFKLPMK